MKIPRLPLITKAFFLIGALSPMAASAWDPIKDLTGKRLDEHVNHVLKEIGNAPESWARCISDIGNCADDLVKRIPYLYLAPVVERYKQHLFNQGEGRWQRFPPYIVLAIQRHYPEINVDGIRYATNVNTLHGKHITWHNHIFFVSDIDFSRPEDVWTVLHELEHTVQYQRRGGEQPFLSEYVLKSAGKVIQTGSFNVHDYIDIEGAANNKANLIVGEVIYNINNIWSSRPELVSNIINEDGTPATQYSNPLIDGRTIDACINSAAFPPERATQCSEPAQRLIADAYCRRARNTAAVEWSSYFTGQFQSSYKYHADVLTGGQIVNERWVADDTGGAIFTSISCR
ncbi:hypothetical protein ACFQUU_16045 [Herbaspirillum sp. GCM10030257]|uniref:hypothetical protein n=1 Tax=Herbaspirillum sp. GCM10030257 TaxID=3273393 RepID=UPI00360B1917